uniref:Uncharacterized protein n=1 Tax=Paramoeba aestuarina TaxID=180227 RepID=A0A7S4L5R8_9EUKA|mmetsp:Transcript_31819/g.49787  ORF Transcript_31819/g.49787 Transcript_31819/m.49787 type:complete len:155 (+) Transcript_31819:149-613(+)
MEWQSLDMQQRTSPEPLTTKTYQKKQPRKLSNSSGAPLFRSSSVVVPRPLKMPQAKFTNSPPPTEKTDFCREVCSIIAPTSSPLSPKQSPPPNHSPFYSTCSSPFEAFSPPDRSHNPITKNSPFFKREMYDVVNDERLSFRTLESEELFQFHLE